jgi:hypothetical protein
MSLGNEYRKSIREKLGISEQGSMGEPTEPDFNSIAQNAAQSAGGSLKMAEDDTLKSIMQYLKDNPAALEMIIKGLAMAEEDKEGMEDPAAASVEVPEVGTQAPEHADLAKSINALSGQGATPDPRMIADDVYLEMLNDFKKKVAACEDAGKKNALTRCYEQLFKLREKMLSEMSAGDENPVK